MSIQGYTNIYTNISSILNKGQEHLLKDIDLQEILLLSQEQIILLISNLNNFIVNNNYYYKFENYNNLFSLLVNIIYEYNKKKNIILPLENIFLSNLSILNLGQKYLEKIKPYIIELTKQKKIDIDKILIIVASKGTLPIYFFWRRLLKNNSKNFMVQLLASSCLNNDMRILKFLITNEKISISGNNIETIFLNIFDSRNSNKKQFKMLKIINERIPLKEYLNIMLYYTDYDLSKCNTICKFYHINNNISYSNITNLISNKLMVIDNDNTTETVEEYNKIIINQINKLMISSYEKILFLIAKNMYICNITEEETLLINSKLFKNIINENKYSIVSHILNNNCGTKNLCVRANNQLLCIIIKEYSTSLFFNQYLTENSVITYYICIGFYTRFFTSTNKTMITINYILHKLRCICKKYKKNKIYEIKIQTAPVINEIKNFIPNKFITVLNKGSYLFQLSKQKFTTLPPRHIIPYEINYLNSCLIKEKSDGINVTKLPININPNIYEVIDKTIKAEYIEEYDLYLVYDINIEDMDILERQTYLRSIHPYTSKLNNFQIITNMNELKENIEYERTNILNFIKSSNEEIKWYPKASFKINKFSEDFIKEINNFIEETNIDLNNYINLNGIIKNDGLIIVPLDGTRELKIKPKSLMTIDLLYKNNFWFDNNNIIHNNIINTNKYKEGKIYRCYPYINNDVYFEPKEIRYDKKRPNTNNIYQIINSIVNFNWLNKLYENNNYYHKTEIVYDNKIKRILEQNKNIFYNFIKKIKPNTNRFWLDLGCGNCKFFNFIKNYNPKKYVGIDCDMKSIINAFKKYNDEPDFEIHNCDLNSDWNKYNLKLFNFNMDILYDYIICNFSLMHFCNNQFWEYLNKFSKTGTLFIFNITIPNCNWSMNNSYLKSNNVETEIFLEWIHIKPIKERIISNEEINNYAKIFEWEILKIDKNNENNLISCYNWYILQKK